MGDLVLVPQKSQRESCQLIFHHPFNEPSGLLIAVSPSLMVLVSLVILLLVKSELNLALKINHIHPCTTMLGDRKIRSVSYTAHSGCRGTDTKAMA